MTMRFRSRFSLRVAVPVPLLAQKPCRASWKWMEDNIQRLMMPDIDFHRTSTRPIPLKSVPPPLGIIYTVWQAQDTTSSPPLKSSFIMATTFSQFPGSRRSSRVIARSHILRCSALMPDRPPARYSCICSTASAISSSSGTLSSTGKGATSIGIGIPGGGMWAYRSVCYAIRVSRDIRAGGGVLSAASLYHPHIRTHASLTRWGSDAKRDLIVHPAFSACLFWYVLMPARIRWLSLQKVHWCPYCHLVNLTSRSAQVLSENNPSSPAHAGGAWGSGSWDLKISFFRFDARSRRRGRKVKWGALRR